MDSQQASASYCLPKYLPADQWLAAAVQAIEINPANAPLAEVMTALLPGTARGIPRPEFLAVLTTKYWGSNGVDLAVAFMEQASQELRDRILSHFNVWGEYANIKFRYTEQRGSAQVRITRQGGGYWSYLGTDVLSIPRGDATMSLHGFTMGTSESEYRRVVRHEVGHTLGFPHEHLRRNIIARLDPRKVIAWGARVLGWDRRTVEQQILTPLEDVSLIASPTGDEVSIMCYSLPGEVTRDGNPIPGGTDLDDADKRFVARLYPKETKPVEPNSDRLTVTVPNPIPAGEYSLGPADAPESAGQLPQLAGDILQKRPDGVAADAWAEFVRKVIEAILSLWSSRSVKSGEKAEEKAEETAAG